MRLLVAARPRPPHTRSACSWRCHTTHVLLARRAHKHYLLTATPNNMYLSPTPTPVSHTQCLPTAIPSHMYVPPRPRPRTRVIAGLVHRHAQQRDGSIAHTATSGMMTPHGKNESIARAGIESKQEWHDTARQKREHRTRWYRKLVLSGMIIQHTPPPDTAVELCMPCQALSTSVRHNARGARDAAQVASKVGGGDVACSVQDGVT